MSLELKTLFHSPDELADDELVALQRRLQVQRVVPKVTAVAGLIGTVALETLVLKRPNSILRVTAGTLGSYALGGQLAAEMNSRVLPQAIDAEIVFAQETRQVSKVLNMTGYGSNHISGDTGLNKNFSKPY